MSIMIDTFIYTYAKFNVSKEFEVRNETIILVSIKNVSYLGI